MPLIGAGAAMELLAAALGHNRDLTAGVAAVFGLVVRRQHTHFGDRIHAGLVKRRLIRSRVHVRYPVHLEVDLRNAAAVDLQDLQRGLAAGLGRHAVRAALRDVGVAKVHTRDSLQNGEQVMAAEGDVRDLGAVNQLRILARSGLYRDRRRSDLNLFCYRSQRQLEPPQFPGLAGG